MPAIMESQEQILNLLNQTLDPTHRKSAEATLGNLEKATQNFPSILLEIVSKSQNYPAVLYLKNLAKKQYPDFAETDKKYVQTHILNTLLNSPKRIQDQLSDTIVVIAEKDGIFLIQDLASNLSPNDYDKNIAILEICHNLFKRWRGEFKSTELFTEIKTVLTLFAPAYLGLFKTTHSFVLESQSNQQKLKVLLDCILLLVKIFQDFICQDLPEFVEDNQDEFMTMFHYYLTFNSPLFVAAEDEAGILENIKTEICSIIDVYAKRYEDDFPKLSVFVETVWELLVSTSLETKNDFLVSKAIGFLTSIVKPARHREMFSNAETLKLICSKIVIPNMTLRDSDIELFEDDPIDYIRRDLEGSDNDSRRRASSDLVRGLLEQFAEQVTSIFGEYVQSFLAEYQQDKLKNWKSKDTALYLLISICARESSVQIGVTKVNEFVPLGPIFSDHILPDLQSPIDSVHPIIKVDVIKYVLLFRSILPNLASVIPILMQHLSSNNYVLYTYACICIERVLTCKEANGKFTQKELKEFCQPLLVQLFQILSKFGDSPLKIAENDYLMKTIMRVIALSREETLPFANEIITELGRIIRIISKNPSNPKFNHYVFESLAALIRFIPGKDASYLASFEGILNPLVQYILQEDVVEFTPYALQILSQLLNLHQEASFPVHYQNLLPPLLQPAPWDNHGNIPALVTLMQAYVVKGSKFIVEHNHVAPFLGIFQKLIVSRMNDQYGFELLAVIFESIPLQALQQYVKNLFLVILNRLNASKTPKFVRGFMCFLSSLFIMNKPGLEIDAIIGIFDSFQANLFAEMLKSVILPEYSNMISPDEIRLCSVGLILFMSRSQKVMSPPYVSLLPSIILSIHKHTVSSSSVTAATKVAEAEEMYLLDIEEAGYQVSFSKLAAAGKKSLDKTENFPPTCEMLKAAYVELNKHTNIVGILASEGGDVAAFQSLFS